MVVVVLSWVYYFFLCGTIGLGIKKLLEKVLNRKWDFQVIDYMVAGITGITIYAAFASLIYKVGIVVHLLLLACAIFCGWKCRSEIKQIAVNAKKLIFSWEGFFFFCFILGIAFFTSRGGIIQIPIFIMHRISDFMKNMEL